MAAELQRIINSLEPEQALSGRGYLESR